MVRNCVENFELKILNEFKLNKKACWMAGGWVEKPSYDYWTMDGRVDGWKPKPG